MLHDELLTSLPVPTAAQTGRFTDHVANNHSWYKHLPFFPPGASFVFFPNFHAGRGMKRVGEQFRWCDVEKGDYFAHHSRLSTVEYVARFGHWDYWVDDNPRVSDPQPGPWMFSADGNRRELLPDELRQQWSCRLTAFLRPAPHVFRLCAGALRREADEFMASGRRSSGLRSLALSSGKQDEDLAARRYRDVAEALRHAAGTWEDAELSTFMKSEALAQRESILSTLYRIRAVWVKSRPA